MSNIPPNMNIVGSMYQSQIAARKAAEKEDAQRNKRVRDSKNIAKLDNQHNEEVEDTEQADGVIVQRQDERYRDGQDAHDTYEKHEQLNDQQEKLYHADGSVEQVAPDQEDVIGNDGDDKPQGIDFSA
ncbi:MAG: hypothetical protein JEZ07_06740 [Phycisphaerae bacterium]|nr:hypothetical protein [Phycisphaerae bacterium]